MVYHILNGDSLKGQLPESISGEKIVARECLVDGDVAGDLLQELFNTRAKFLSDNYGGSEKDYFDKSAPEFLKIEQLPKTAEINLWFEDDLFCQVNLWFIIHLLFESGIDGSINLIRPSTDIQYGFGGMSSADLIEAKNHKKKIDEPTLCVLRKLWRLYQNKNHQEMLDIVEAIEDGYGFMKTAIQAEIERFPKDGSIGRPKQTLIDIMAELKTENFDTIFREFNKREAVYGFGDLQVKRIFDEIQNNN